MKSTNHKVIMSQLQSRVAQRSAHIRKLEEWKVVYRAMNQMQDWRDTKAAIKAKADEQVLDKKALATINQAEKITMEYNNLYQAYDQACAMLADLADDCGESAWAKIGRALGDEYLSNADF